MIDAANIQFRVFLFWIVGGGGGGGRISGQTSLEVGRGSCGKGAQQVPPAGREARGSLTERGPGRAGIQDGRLLSSTRRGEVGKANHSLGEGNRGNFRVPFLIHINIG